jgi:hypothetical protein
MISIGGFVRIQPGFAMGWGRKNLSFAPDGAIEEGMVKRVVINPKIRTNAQPWDAITRERVAVREGGHGVFSIGDVVITHTAADIHPEVVMVSQLPNCTRQSQRNLCCLDAHSW